MHRGKKQYGAWIALVCLLWACLFIGAYLYLRNREGFAETVSDCFSMPIRHFLGRISSFLPVSVMECLYALVIVGVIVFLILSIVSIVKARRRGYTALRQGLILVTVAAYLYAGYGWLWGMDYYREGFAEKSAIEVTGVSQEELLRVTAYFALKAGEYSTQVQRDGAGHACVEKSALLDGYEIIYKQAEQAYPVLQGEVTRPKEMIFSRLMSYLGFTGIYFPFSGESNLNMDAPVGMFGFTVAHELAHQKGITAEQEANFCGIYACVTCENTEFVYSGYLGGLVYLSNALYSANPEAYAAVRTLFTEQVLQDMQDNNDYWQSFETKVSEVSSQVYDAYLKSNGQTSGIRSYGQCVDLLCAVFYDEAKAAVSLSGK